MAGDRYARVYYDRIAQDAKFDGMRGDRTMMGAWLLCLVEAEKAWPSPAFPLPESWVPRAEFDELGRRGLVDVLEDGRYIVHGLTAERATRSAHGRLAADARWSAESNAPSIPPSNARASAASNARREEKSIEEQTSRARAREDAASDDEITATFLELTHRAPSKAQSGVIADYLATFDVSGTERGREVMCARPTDPIGALIDDLASFREERRSAARREEEAARRKHRRERLEADRSEVVTAFFGGDAA